MPFQSVYYVTPPNAAGDRLVVGKPFSAQQLVQWIRSVPLADANTGPKFCGFVQLAPGLAVQAYLPTLPERQGDFSNFVAQSGQLIDPTAGIAFPGGIIPLTRFGDIFAWRIPADSAPGLPPSYSAGSVGPFTTAPLFALGQDVALSLLAASAGGFACSTTVIQPSWLNGLNPQGQYGVVSFGPVDLVVTDALGRITSRSSQAIPDSAYFELDFGGALPHPLDVVLIRQSVEAQGNYKIGVIPDATAKTGDAFSLVTVSGTPTTPQVRVLAGDSLLALGQTATFSDAPLFTASAASYAPPGEMAPNMIMVSLASGLARGTEVATDFFIPQQLLNTQVMIADSGGGLQFTGLLFVTESAVAFLVPPLTALGDATVTILGGTGTTVSQPMVVKKIIPSLFTANSSGSGVPAGFWIRSANGTLTQDYLFDPAKPAGSRVPLPIDLGPAGDQVFLSLYGTGFRGATQATATVGGVTVPVYGFTSVDAYLGEDIVNIGPLPPSLAGRGQVDVVISFEGTPANTVTTNIR
jgi:uncharacterized protein (TIGR03437 family)